MEQLVNDLLTETDSLAETDRIKKIKSSLRFWQPKLLRSNNNLIHLSASCVIKHNQKVLFVEHPYLKKSLLPAGHVEPFETPLQTALRELTEETGYNIKDISKIELVDVNLIRIPANPKKQQPVHEHIDFRYQIEGTLIREAPGEQPNFWLEKSNAPEEFWKYF